MWSKSVRPMSVWQFLNLLFSYLLAIHLSSTHQILLVHNVRETCRVLDRLLAAPKGMRENILANFHYWNFVPCKSKLTCNFLHCRATLWGDHQNGDSRHDKSKNMLTGTLIWPRSKIIRSFSQYLSFSRYLDIWRPKTLVYDFKNKAREQC